MIKLLIGIVALISLSAFANISVKLSMSDGDDYVLKKRIKEIPEDFELAFVQRASDELVSRYIVKGGAQAVSNFQFAYMAVSDKESFNKNRDNLRFCTIRNAKELFKKIRKEGSVTLDFVVQRVGFGKIGATDEVTSYSSHFVQCSHPNLSVQTVGRPQDQAEVDLAIQAFQKLLPDFKVEQVSVRID